jgi:hypothetical protein
MDPSISRPGRPVVSTFRLNRRSHTRYVMVLRDGFLHADGQRVPCVVRNISSGGLLARIYRAVELGESLRIELAGGRLLDGIVLWTRDWEVGVAFPRPIDVEAILAEQWVTETGEDRRTSRRIAVECPATLQVRRRFYYGKLCDISPTGAKVRTRGTVKKIDEAILSLPGLPPLRAALRWVNGSDCGLSFREHVPAEALAIWLEERG